MHFGSRKCCRKCKVLAGNEDYYWVNMQKKRNAQEFVHTQTVVFVSKVQKYNLTDSQLFKLNAFIG